MQHFITIYNSFILTCLLFCYLGSCYEFSPFTNMSVSNVLKEIRGLDNSLLDLFTTLPKGKGPRMLEYMKLYIQAMKEMVYYAYENKTKTKIEANDLIEQVGPEFLEYNFDKEKIRENFEWESKEYDDMYDLRLKTVKVWNDFQDNF
uniref:Uncharacterized protein n=1 Tax=Homalodisca liturata TaxID=320908 RepID=A0A1B6IW87_9HEMI